MTARRCAPEMAADLALYWEIRGFYSEGRHWLAQVLAIQTGENPGCAAIAGQGQSLE